MSRFDNPLSYAILFIGIILASTILILLVTADAKHRKEAKDSYQVEVPHETLFVSIRHRWTEFWYGKSDIAIVNTTTIETNEIPHRLKRDLNSERDKSGIPVKSSRIGTIREGKPNLFNMTNEPSKGIKRKVSHITQQNPKRRKLMWSQFLDEGYESDVDTDDSLDDDRYMDAAVSARKRKTSRLRSTWPENRDDRLVVTKRHKHNSINAHGLGRARTNGGIRKDLYVFTNNSMYFVGSHKSALVAGRKNKHKHESQTKLCFTIVELIVAATASAALTITFIMLPVLVWFYCHSSKKSRRVDEPFRPDSWWVSDNVEDVSNTTRSSLIAGQDGALLFTKSYVQPTLSNKTQPVGNSDSATKKSTSFSARKSISPPCIEATIEEKKLSALHSAKKTTPKSDVDTSRRVIKPRVSGELLSFDS